jgi:hypothetical protein
VGNSFAWTYGLPVAAYVAAATIIFVWLRRHSSTDSQAASLLDEDPGFGESTTLGSAAAQFFKHPCSRLLLLLVAASWTVRLAVAQWTWTDLLVIGGIVAFWPIQEWLVHVFLLHCKPLTLFGHTFDPIIARNHRNHHQDPWHPELGITPPHIIWLYLSGLPGVWFLFLPPPQAITGVVIYFSLVLNYEWIHYLIHTSYVPKSFVYKRLWRNHRLHHFKNEHYWYGVTMLAGDRLLQTQPVAAQTRRSGTCMTLGAERDLAEWSEVAQAPAALPVQQNLRKAA